MKNLFPKSLTGATIQDSGMRERKSVMIKLINSKLQKRNYYKKYKLILVLLFFIQIDKTF